MGKNYNDMETNFNDLIGYEIRFHAQRILKGNPVQGVVKEVDGEWVDVDLCTSAVFDNDGKPIFRPTILFWDDGFVNPPVDPLTVGQFTGLKDRNGVEAYDGDDTDDGVIVWHPDYLGFFVDCGEDAVERWRPLYDIPFFEIIATIPSPSNAEGE